MNKYFLFLSNSPIDKGYFEESLRAAGGKFEIVYENPRKGYFVADSTFYGPLEPLLMTMHDDLGIVITVLVSHERKALEEKALREAVSYFPNQALFVTDLLLKEFSFGDFSSLPLLRNEFRGVHHDLMLTAGAYLRSGMNAIEASKALFIHRNTFNYRLHQFIDATGLDIRDYHNALLLELYFQYAARGLD